MSITLEQPIATTQSKPRVKHEGPYTLTSKERKLGAVAMGMIVFLAAAALIQSRGGDKPQAHENVPVHIAKTPSVER